MITDPDHLARVVCRPALMRDKKFVIEFTRTIWNGNDYLPEVWDDWIKDYDGQFITAEFGGKVVGVIKLTRLAPDQWWIEGLRVDPEYQRRGIGSVLFNYILDEWRDRLSGPIRFITNSVNFSIHHFAEKNGFSKVGDYSHFESNTGERTEDHYFPVDSCDAPMVMEFYEKTADKSLLGPYIDVGWAYCEVNEGAIVEAIKRKHMWWWKDRQGLLMIFEEIDGEEKQPFIMAIACQRKDLVECLVEYRSLCKDLGYDKAFWSASIASELDKYLAKAGFIRAWEKSVFLFEKQHD